MKSPETPNSEGDRVPLRIHSLDGVRALAMVLGLPMHASLSFCVPWCGIIDSSTTPLASDILSGFYGFFHHFRMQLFFLIAGFFARQVIACGACYYVKNRLFRVGIPLVAAVIICLPMVDTMTNFGEARVVDRDARIRWSEVIQNIASIAYWRELRPHYLWFLTNLMICYCIALGVHSVLDIIRLRDTLNEAVDWCFSKLRDSRWIAFLMAGAMIGVNRLTGQPLFVDESMSFVPTLSNLLSYGGFFAFGWALFDRRRFLTVIAKHWRFHYAMGLSVWLLTAYWGDVECQAGQAFLAWSLSLGVLGFMSSFADRQSSAVTYLADSSYWIYLAHVPLLMYLQVTWAYCLLSWWLKFLMMIVVLLSILLVSYDVFIRGTWIGAILNGRRRCPLYMKLLN